MTHEQKLFGRFWAFYMSKYASNPEFTLFNGRDIIMDKDDNNGIPYFWHSPLSKYSGIIIKNARDPIAILYYLYDFTNAKSNGIALSKINVCNVMLERDRKEFFVNAYIALIMNPTFNVKYINFDERLKVLHDDSIMIYNVGTIVRDFNEIKERAELIWPGNSNRCFSFYEKEFMGEIPLKGDQYVKTLMYKYKNADIDGDEVINDLKQISVDGRRGYRTLHCECLKYIQLNKNIRTAPMPELNYAPNVYPKHFRVYSKSKNNVIIYICNDARPSIYKNVEWGRVNMALIKGTNSYACCKSHHQLLFTDPSIRRVTKYGVTTFGYDILMIANDMSLTEFKHINSTYREIDYDDVDVKKFAYLFHFNEGYSIPLLKKLRTLYNENRAILERRFVVPQIVDFIMSYRI